MAKGHKKYKRIARWCARAVNAARPIYWAALMPSVLAKLAIVALALDRFRKLIGPPMFIN